MDRIQDEVACRFFIAFYVLRGPEQIHLFHNLGAVDGFVLHLKSERSISELTLMFSAEFSCINSM